MCAGRCSLSPHIHERTFACVVWADAGTRFALLFNWTDSHCQWLLVLCVIVPSTSHNEPLQKRDPDG